MVCHKILCVLCHLQAELDRMLVEAGGALMPPFVKLVGSDRLMAEVEAFVENLLKSLVSLK